MPTKKQPSIVDELARGQELLNAGDSAGAKACFDAVLKRDSACGLAYVGLGQVAFAKGFLDDAAALMDEAYEVVLEEEYDGALPDRLPWTPAAEPLLRAIHGQGMVAYRRGDADAARERFALLKRLNPSDEQGAAFFLDAIAKKRSWADMGSGS